MKVRLTPRFARVSGILAASALAMSTFAIPPFGSAQAAPTNGPLIYSYGGSGGARVVNLDGTSGTVPTFMAGFAPGYTYAAFSTDGTKVTWIEATPMQQTEYKLYVADANGSNKKLLTTTTSVRITKPQFTADKSKIVFYNGGGGLEIYAVDATIENQTLSSSHIILAIAAGGINDVSISSTDKIAYISTMACGPGNYGVKTRTFAGQSSDEGTVVSTSCDQNSTPTVKSNSVQWSSDSSKLYVGISTYNSGTQARTYSVSAINADGSGSRTSLTTATASIDAIAMSPDGTKLAFGTVEYTFPPTMKLFTMNLDGTGVSTVKTATDALAQVSWVPPFPGTGGTTTTAPAATTTVAPTTTTTVPKPVAVAGVTVTDATVYSQAPSKVASGSAITVLSPAQAKASDIVSITPAVCVAANDDLVFIDNGRCVARVVSEKTGKVLRTLKTTVVNDEVSELRVGNETVVLAPIYFDGGTAEINAAALRRIKAIKDRVSAAGTVLLVGHSGILMGNTPENQAMAKARAQAVAKSLKSVGASGPFYSVSAGSLDPATTVKTREAQAKNRRVIIVLIP